MRVYTDGASSNNQRAELREGGWAFVLMTEPPRVTYGYQDGATNNQMELLALGKAVEAVLNLGYQGDLQVATDSTYVIGAFSGNKIKANAELIAHIKRRALGAGLRMRFEHVRGHSGDRFNELCDQYARLAIRNRTTGPVTEELRTAGVPTP